MNEDSPGAVQGHHPDGILEQRITVVQRGIRSSPRTRRWRARLGVILLVGLVGASGWWAGQVTAPVDPTDGDQASAPVTAVATRGQVGRTLNLNVTVRQEFVQIAANSLAGVVTRVHDPGTVDVGDVLYSVAEVPVRAVAGTLPFYRDLGRGARGQDVRQLQDALAVLGYLAPGSDGLFGPEVESAVKAWQRSAGQTPTGAVLLGELVAVPSLPAAVRLSDGVAPGLNLSGGEEAVFSPSGDLAFEMVVTTAQSAMIPHGASVIVRFGDLSWPAKVTSNLPDENGSIVLMLTAQSGDVVCGEDCGVLPAQESLTLLSEVEIVAQTEGVTIPVAAIRTGTDGRAYVVTTSGERLEVTTSASAGGVAVVEGLDEGTEVLVGVAAPEESAGVGDA